MMDDTRNTFTIIVTRTDGSIADYEVEQSTMDWACRWVARNVDLMGTETVTIQLKPRKGSAS